MTSKYRLSSLKLSCYFRKNIFLVIKKSREKNPFIKLGSPISRSKVIQHFLYTNYIKEDYLLLPLCIIPTAERTCTSSVSTLKMNLFLFLKIFHNVALTIEYFVSYRACIEILSVFQIMISKKLLFNKHLLLQLYFGLF